MEAYHVTVFTFSLFSALNYLVLNLNTDSFIVCPFSNSKWHLHWKVGFLSFPYRLSGECFQP